MCYRLPDILYAEHFVSMDFTVESKLKLHVFLIDENPKGTTAAINTSDCF